MTKLERFKAWLAEDKIRQKGLKNWEEILAKVDEARFNKSPILAIVDVTKDFGYLSVVKTWEVDDKINYVLEFKNWLAQHPNDLPNWEKFIDDFLYPTGVGLSLSQLNKMWGNWDELIEYWKIYRQWMIEIGDDGVGFYDRWFKRQQQLEQLDDYQAQIKELEQTKGILQTRLKYQEQKIKALSQAGSSPPWLWGIILLVVVMWVVK